MDELDLLKKDWKKQEKSLPQLTYDQLYKLIWKRSSSIVKWIFIISILEFLLGVILNLVLADDDYWKQMEEYELTSFTIAAYVVSYLITFYFIYRFYRNYKKISTTDSASILMQNILKTRKTVKYYIGFILVSSGIVFLVDMFLILRHHALTAEPVEVSKNMSFSLDQWLLLIGGTLMVLVVFLGIIWILYRIMYGILLKRLYKNYKDLKEIESE